MRNVYNMAALVTPTQFHRRFPAVSVQLISMWRSRGLVTPVGYVGRAPLYELGHLLAAERRTRREPRGRRRTNPPAPEPTACATAA